MRKILILGGTGTISTPITSTLAKDPNVHLTLINRGHHNEQCDPHIEILVGDMNQPLTIKELLQDRSFDCVIDFILYTPQQAKERLALFKGITKQFFFISTVACLDHEHHLLINEETPRGNRFSLYGQNKAAAEEHFLEAYQNEGFPITIIRPSQTYSEDRIPLSIKGKGCWPVIQRMMDGKEVLIHGDGESVWASTHSVDFAKGFIPLINHPNVIGEIIQIMNPASHTWNEVYRSLADLLNVEYKPVFVSSVLLASSTTYDFKTSIQGDKMWSCLYDITKLKHFVPQYSPSISLKEGLKKYLDFMKEHPDLKTKEIEFDVWCDEVILQLKQKEMIK